MRKINVGSVPVEWYVSKFASESEEGFSLGAGRKYAFNDFSNRIVYEPTRKVCPGRGVPKRDHVERVKSVQGFHVSCDRHVEVCLKRREVVSIVVRESFGRIEDKKDKKKKTLKQNHLKESGYNKTYIELQDKTQITIGRFISIKKLKQKFPSMGIKSVYYGHPNGHFSQLYK